MENKSRYTSGKSNTERKREGVKRKANFITAYVEWGTVLKACELTGISRQTYQNWHSNDYAFANEMVHAKRSFGEALEGIALDRVKNPDKGKGSDILLLGMLNANMSEKYRPNLALNEDSAREVISELRKISREKRSDGTVKEGGSGLSAPMEKTLAEILEKRGAAPKDKDVE